ncbi:hypothetical protein Y1Q_0009546 [Alligator mississippiensis]|uniref:Uncharacterized protein n=1 Tax=Alligator mississippiensis TaxID=8496 RepID=A0A151NUS3_ALLMI|nr:hypothetical protein Y1Q_0009546 [Alligator mississippiensis]
MCLQRCSAAPAHRRPARPRTWLLAPEAQVLVRSECTAWQGWELVRDRQLEPLHSAQIRTSPLLPATTLPRASPSAVSSSPARIRCPASRLGVLCPLHCAQRKNKDAGRTTESSGSLIIPKSAAGHPNTQAAHSSEPEEFMVYKFRPEETRQIPARHHRDQDLDSVLVVTWRVIHHSSQFARRELQNSSKNGESQLNVVENNGYHYATRPHYC